MSIDIRFPNITGFTEAEQIAQIKSYLHQLVQQLNWALSTIEASTGTPSVSSTSIATSEISEETILELKYLLIESSAALNDYYEKINQKLEGSYVKSTDFDAYKLEVAQTIDGLQQQIDALQQQPESQ